MGTALTWANVLAEKPATARIINVGCIFASAMIKRRKAWLRWFLVCNEESDTPRVKKADREERGRVGRYLLIYLLYPLASRGC